jgi:hypothetical protein
MLEGVEKIYPVLVALEYSFLFIAPRGDVVDGARIFDS